MVDNLHVSSCVSFPRLYYHHQLFLKNIYFFHTNYDQMFDMFVAFLVECNGLLGLLLFLTDSLPICSHPIPYHVFHQRYHLIYNHHLFILKFSTCFHVELGLDVCKRPTSDSTLQELTRPLLDQSPSGICLFMGIGTT